MKYIYFSLILLSSTMSFSQSKQVTVAIYLQDGVEVLDFAGPMEVFAYAGFKVFTVAETSDPIISQGILKIIPEYSLDNAPAADIITIVGGNSRKAFIEGGHELVAWIKSRIDKTDYFFSVCTGVYPLGRAGLLDGQTVTTFYQNIEDLRQRFPGAKVIKGARFVDNGKVVTTAGVSAGIDGALHMVAKLKGEAAARQAAEYMEYDKWAPDDGLILSKN
ncbi:MAG TPA: hypothetical protein DIS90_13470 [Cytophagales bacterium]|nr:hypothetical protein [Cytophagales bacterium]HCR53216.1 hypothetical protein [Cytophagales bacterium]